MNKGYSQYLLSLGIIFLFLLSISFSGCINSNPDNLLKGQIAIIDQNVSFTNASVYITLKDASNSSEPSKIVKQESLGNITVNKGKNNTFPYIISKDKLENGKNYSIFVHVDADKDGVVSKGDLISTKELLINSDSKSLDVFVNLMNNNSVINKIFTKFNNNSVVDVNIYQLNKISLQENPTTGYSWNMSFPKEFTILKDQFISGKKDVTIVGGGGIHEWIFTASKTGTYNVSGIYRQPWENTTNDETKFSLMIRVHDK